VGTGTGAGTGTGTGTTITPQGNCAKLTCIGELYNAMADCTPSGACTSQESTLGSNYCYANGVKMGLTINITTMSANMTIKNASKVCLIAEVTGNTIVYKNSAGKTIATADATTNATTCADGSTGIMDDTCGGNSPSTSNPNSTENCTPGTCTL
jgi:hypothetical protein